MTVLTSAYWRKREIRSSSSCSCEKAIKMGAMQKSSAITVLAQSAPKASALYGAQNSSFATEWKQTTKRNTQSTNIALPTVFQPKGSIFTVFIP